MTDKPKDVFAEAAAIALKKYPPRIVTITQSKADFELGDQHQAPFSHSAFKLNGRDFATLNALELNLFRALRATGRKFGIVVSVDVINDDENIQAALAAASPEQQEEIYRRLRTEVAVQWAMAE